MQERARYVSKYNDILHKIDTIVHSQPHADIIITAEEYDILWLEYRVMKMELPSGAYENLYYYGPYGRVRILKEEGFKVTYEDAAGFF